MSTWVINLADVRIGSSETVFVCQRSLSSVGRPLRIVVGRVIHIDVKRDHESVNAVGALDDPIMLEMQLECSDSCNTSAFLRRVTWHDC